MSPGLKDHCAHKLTAAVTAYTRARQSILQYGGTPLLDKELWTMASGSSQFSSSIWVIVS